MSDIFISYEKSDLRYAEMLAHSFGVCGWTTFWDRTIPAGSAWRKTIGRELDSARCVVVLWSKASLDSDWVHEEADDARRRGILVPVLIEDIQAPIGFRTIQAGNLVNWDGTESTRAFRRLVTDIAVKIGPPPNVEVEEGKRPAAVIEPNAESKPVGSEAEPESEVRSKTDSKTDEETGAGPKSKKEDPKIIAVPLFEHRSRMSAPRYASPWRTTIVIPSILTVVAIIVAVYSLGPRLAPNAEPPGTTKPDKRPAAVIEPNAESKPVRRENSQYLIVVYYQGPQREREAQAVGAALAAKGFRYHVEDTDLRSTKLNKPRGWIFIQPADKGTDVIDDVAAIVRTMSAPDKVEVEGTLNRTMNGDVQVQLW